MSDHRSKTSHATSTSSRNSHNSSSISVASHDNIRLTVVNANGINGKRAELAELSNSTQADVMVITETKLDNTKSPSEFLPKNYEVPAHYRPPSDPTDSLSNLQSTLEELAELTKNSPKSSVIVAGDFYARDIDWKMLVPTQECKKKGLCNDLITILGVAGLHQMQRECTWDGAIFDLFCINNPSPVKAIDTIPGISDHDGIILVDLHLKAQINKKPRRIPLWSRANWEAIKAESLSFCGNFLKTCSARDASTNWDLFVMLIQEMQTRHIPTKLTSSRFNLPWL